MVSQLGMWIATAATAALIVGALVAAVRAPPDRAEDRWRLAVPLAAIVFFLALGIKLGVLQTFGWQHPYFDQWSEGLALYSPYLQGKLRWAYLAQPHNEHRIFFSRLLALALFDLNRQWDNQVQAVANGVLHALTLAWMTFAVARRLATSRALLFALATLSLLGLPFARENVVWGFQSPFYLLELFAPLALWLMTQCRVRSFGFWAGAACCAACLFSIGSGPLCALAIAAVGGLWLWQRPSTRTEPATIVAVGMVVFLAGLLLRGHSDPKLGAHDYAEFVRALCRTLAYPLIDTPWAVVLLWTPILLLALRSIALRVEMGALDRFSLALGIFAALHGPAVAYARGAGGAPPGTRYFDLLALGVVANLLAAFSLIERASQPGTRAARVLLMVWLTAVFGGGAPLLHRMLGQELPAVGESTRRQERALARLARTGNTDLLHNNGPSGLPYPDVSFLEQQLADPFVRSVLPAAVRAPLSIEPESAGGFVRGNLPHDAAPAPIEPTFCDFPKMSGAAGGGQFRSQPIQPTLPYLRFELTGYFIGPGEELGLLGPEAAVAVPLPPSPGTGWINRIVRRPEGPVRVLATDARSDAWFGFSAPVELGTLSMWAHKSIHRWRSLVSMGLGLSLLALGWAAARWSREGCR
jgi:hypothetical protein